MRFHSIDDRWSSGPHCAHTTSAAPDHVDLILEFSDWVLSRYPDGGLDIFTEDVADVARLSKQRILEHLKENHGRLVVPYLERVIRVWNDPDATFHDGLIYGYTELMRKRGGGEPAADERIARDAREKLLSFLKRSDHYSQEKMLLLFPIREGNNFRNDFL